MAWRYTLPKKSEQKLSDKFYYGFSKQEIIWIIIFIIIASFMSFIPIIPNDNPIKIITTFLIFTIIILTNIIAKKIGSKNYSIKIEHKVWEFQRWGFYKRAKFKKPIPMGLIAPFFLTLFSLGYLKPFVFFQFNAENLPAKRILKATGGRRAERKEQINEEDLAYTAAWGFYSLLLLAIIGAIITSFLNLEFGANLAKYSIYFGLWNLLPFFNLDGIKLFFGAFLGWVFITFLYLIGLLVVML